LVKGHQQKAQETNLCFFAVCPHTGSATNPLGSREAIYRRHSNKDSFSTSSPFSRKIVSFFYKSLQYNRIYDILNTRGDVMKKQEKLNLIERAIRNVEICRCYFSYDNNYFYYYPNAVNEKFILGQEEDDFLLDGYAIRKISHLKKVEVKDDKCNEINREFGVTAQVQSPNVNISSWQSIFNCLKAFNDIIIIEDEINEEFAIGIIKKVLKNKLYFLDFDADGIWSDRELEIPYSCITSVQWNTRYATTWKKHLKNKGLF